MTTETSQPIEEEQEAAYRPLVMLVDDDKNLVDGVNDLLNINGYEVWVADDGQQALEMMQERSPDIIISDIAMPVMDGYEFYERVRNNPSWIPIPFLFLSARKQPVDIRRGRELGADEYITKPFDPPDLLLIVNNRWRRTQEIRKATMDKVERIKKQLIYVMGHELNTPLTYIYGYVNLLRDERSMVGEKDLAEMLAGVGRGADRMKRLIDNLLFLIKLDSGVLQDEIRLGAREFDLADSARCVIEDMARLAKESKVTLQLEAPEELIFTGVRLYVKDVLCRLIDNAIKFTYPGTGVVTVRIWQEGEQTRIDVIDNGMGVHPDDQKVIFQRFQQINRETMEQPGTGLGLSISRELMTLMGGDIWVTSAPGEGSTFSLLFPMVVPTSPS